MSFGDLAEPLIRLGIHVAPAHPNKKRSFLKSWQNLASVSRRQIEYWDRTYANANVIVVCGEASNISVIDVDVKDGVDGNAALLKHKENGFTLPPRPMVRSPSGGLHLYFKHQKGLLNAVGLSKTGRGIGVGVDYRTSGGSVCGPGSTIDGKAYTWIGEAPTTPESFPILPAWVIRCLRIKTLPKKPVPPEFKGNFDGILKAVIESQKSRRNSVVYWAANRMKDEGASDSDYAALMSACSCIARPDDPPPEFMESCRRSIESALGRPFNISV